MPKVTTTTLGHIIAALSGTRRSFSRTLNTTTNEAQSVVSETAHTKPMLPHIQSIGTGVPGWAFAALFGGVGGGFTWLKSDMDRRFDGIEKKFDKADARFDKLEEKIDIIIRMKK